MTRETSRRHRATWMPAILVGAIAIAGAHGLRDWRRTGSARAALSERLQEATTELEELRATEARLPELERELAETRRTWHDYRSEITGFNAPPSIHWAREMAEEAGLTVRELGGGAWDKDKSWTGYTIVMTAKGPRASHDELLERIAGERGLAHVRHATISLTEGRRPRVDVTLRITRVQANTRLLEEIEREETAVISSEP